MKEDEGLRASLGYAERPCVKHKDTLLEEEKQQPQCLVESVCEEGIDSNCGWGSLGR